MNEKMKRCVEKYEEDIKNICVSKWFADIFWRSYLLDDNYPKIEKLRLFSSGIQQKVGILQGFNLLNIW